MAKKPELYQKLPRERYIGTVIGFIALYWSARLAEPLLEGPLEKYRVVLNPVIIAVTIAGFFYLKYVFTRAFYGFLLLVVTHSMQLAMAENVPMRWVYSVICYAIGILCMYFIANPNRFRDVLQLMGESKKYRTISLSICTSMGLISIIFAFVSR